jgi:serine phosphatase RsbU (regulator of sigma subunit)
LDLHSRTIVLTRNNPSPLYVCTGETIDRLDAESIPLGTSRDVRPLITELQIEPGLTIVIHSDGLTHAGERRGSPMDVGETIRSVMEDQEPSPQDLADSLLAQAVSLDDNRPADDISVLVLKFSPLNGDNVRRLTVRLPIDANGRI